MKTQNGFTLMELMVAVAIVGILTAVAVPIYSDYVIRGKIPDATSNLASKRVAMEQFYQDNPQAGYANAGAPICPDTTSSQYFDFSCTGLTATTYTLTATGKGTMTGFTYTINEKNAKGTPSVPAGWTNSGTCWITAKGGTC